MLQLEKASRKMVKIYFNQPHNKSEAVFKHFVL